MGDQNLRRGDGAKNAEQGVDDMLLADKDRREYVCDDNKSKGLSVKGALDRSSDEDTHVCDEDDSKEPTINDEDLIPEVTKVVAMGFVG